jgi:hypothetical protein
MITMTSSRQLTYSRDHVAFTLRRTGYGKVAAKVQRDLPDPVTYEQLEAFLVPYGITLNEILSRLGASP